MKIETHSGGHLHFCLHENLKGPAFRRRLCTQVCWVLAFLVLLLLPTPGRAQQVVGRAGNCSGGGQCTLDHFLSRPFYSTNQLIAILAPLDRHGLTSPTFERFEGDLGDVYFYDPYGNIIRIDHNATQEDGSCQPNDFYNYSQAEIITHYATPGVHGVTLSAYLCDGNTPTTTRVAKQNASIVTLSTGPTFASGVPTGDADLGPCCEGDVGDPINSTYGNVWIQQQDHSLPGFPAGIQLTRT